MTEELEPGEDIETGKHYIRRSQFDESTFSINGSVDLTREEIQTLAEAAGFKVREPSTEYVANSPVAWGKGRHSTDALEQLAANIHGGGIDGSLDVSIARVRGFNGMDTTPATASVNADEILSVDHFDIPKHELMSLNSAITDLEIMAERILVENEVDEENSDE